MKAVLLLPIISAILLPSCVTYDPDYTREAAQIKDVAYPADKIVGMWMQVGYGKLGDMLMEIRVYDQYNADGTGVSRSVRMLPAIYSQYKDLYSENTDFSGDETIESNFTWIYLGKNKWKSTSTGHSRIISQPAWVKTTFSGKYFEPTIARYHNGKLFLPKSHSTAISMHNEAAVKAKLATIRAVNESHIRNTLEFKRQLKNPYGLMPLQGNSQGYDPVYGSTQYFQ